MQNTRSRPGSAHQGIKLHLVSEAAELLGAMQVEMGAQLAVIHEQLKAIPDHEQRIRVLEAAKAKMIGASLVIGALGGGAASWIALPVTRRCRAWTPWPAATPQLVPLVPSDPRPPSFPCSSPCTGQDQASDHYESSPGPRR